jgi:putative Ca2+/H+ antiporter (TMEM165/GDT1 family)
VATLLNHALAASVGAWLASLISPQFLNRIVGLSFTGCSLWALKPDALEGNLRKGTSVFLVPGHLSPR